MVIGVVGILGVLAVVLVPVLFLRSVGKDQQGLEEEPHRSSVRTMSYVVPRAATPSS